MSKPIHPIRKMQRDIWAVRADRAKLERKIARHVKPLLDALEELLGSPQTANYAAAEHLLAAWKEPIK